MMKQLIEYIEEGLLTGQDKMMQAGDEFDKHHKELKKEWSDFKKIKVTDFKDITSDEDYLYRYIWHCPAIIKEYFKELVDELDIQTVEIYIEIAPVDAVRNNINMTVGPVNSKDIGIIDSYPFYYGYIDKDTPKKMLTKCVKMLKQQDIIDEIIDSFKQIIEWM